MHSAGTFSLTQMKDIPKIFDIIFQCCFPMEKILVVPIGRLCDCQWKRDLFYTLVSCYSIASYIS